LFIEVTGNEGGNINIDKAISLRVTNHIKGIKIVHLIGDKWGINVHPEVTLTWQANDIILTSTFISVR